MKLIDKDKIAAEIEKLKGKISDSSSYCNGWQHALRMLEISLDSLEVKEIVDYEEPDLTPIFEEMGIEPDSKIAVAFRNAFYKGVDNFCKRKENEL